MTRMERGSDRLSDQLSPRVSGARAPRRPLRMSSSSNFPRLRSSTGAAPSPSRTSTCSARRECSAWRSRGGFLRRDRESASGSTSTPRSSVAWEGRRGESDAAGHIPILSPFIRRPRTYLVHRICKQYGSHRRHFIPCVFGVLLSPTIAQHSEKSIPISNCQCILTRLQCSTEG